LNPTRVFEPPFDLTASSSAQLTADKQMLAASRNNLRQKDYKSYAYNFNAPAALPEDDDVPRARAGISK